MPEISVDVDTSVDIDVDIIDILDECDSAEIDEAIEYLQKEGFLRGKTVIKANASYEEEVFAETVDKLAELYLRISPEDWAIVKTVIDKY